MKGLDDEKDRDKAEKLNKKMKAKVEDIQDEPDSEDNKDNLKEERYKLNRHILDNFEFVMDDAKILSLLDMLPQGHDDDFYNYTTITTILKAHKKSTFGMLGARETKRDIIITRISKYGIGLNLFITLTCWFIS